ncbi:MAG TPA: EAL domain-containing protein [Candidatus Sulfotelmatobacter sp.]|jgi:diguanylate cyclase (GGDEF)-like protein/PAS domain S-box-containing protein|nr:EAL domain-containing protein [Candidatus Sulfotelmatobacter sp.]
MIFSDAFHLLLTVALGLLWTFVFAVYLRRLNAGGLDRGVKALVILLAADAVRGLISATIGGSVVSETILPPENVPTLLLGLRLVGAGIGLAALLVLTRLWLPRAIAERRFLTDRVENAVTRLRSVMEQAPDAIYIHDFDGRFQDVNQAASDMVGYSREELLGMTVFDIEVGLNPDEVRALWLDLVRGERFNIKGEQRRKDGSLFPVEVSGSTIQGEDGQLLIMGMARDITERQEEQFALQRAVEDLFQANTRAETAIATKNKFLETVSHKLRTPLNSILGLTETILAGVWGPMGNPKISEYLRDIHVSGVDLMKVIDELASVASIEAALASEHQSYRTIVEMSPDAVFHCRDGRIVFINASGIRLLGGHDRNQFEGHEFSEFVHPDYADLISDNFRPISSTPGSTQMKLVPLRGKPQDVTLAVTAAPEGDGSVLAVARNISDIIRAARDVAAHSKRLNSILDTAVDAIVVADEHGVIETYNRAAEQIFGFSAHEAVGSNVALLMPEDTARGHDQFMRRFLDAPASPKAVGIGREVTAKRKDGTTFPAEISLSVCHLDDRRLFTAIIRDITERRSFEDHLAHFATHDTLTSLPNRHLFQSHLQMALDKAKTNGQMVAVWFVDLDGFKMVNDVMGHSAGDELLVDAGLRLLDAVKPEDTVARFGGDEFVLIRNGLRTPQEITEAADEFLRYMSRPFTLRGREVALSSNLGIALYPQDAHTASDLVACAGAAMIVAKASGQNHYRFFDPSMHHDSVERLTLENELRRGIAQDELVLHYQPQVCTRSGRILGLEALVRWNHPTMGMVPPGRFISVAEQSGLIMPLGEWVLNRACKDLRHLQDLGIADVSVAVNISPKQFAETDVEALIRQAVAVSGIDPSRLDVEITESTLMNDPERVISHLEQLKTTGIQLSIDDFGTGYSSLNYLKRFPVDTLKIDRSFVIDIAKNSKDEAIAVTIITLAHSMGMTALAEGVEYEAQSSLLSRLGCDVIQGYLYSKPQPFDVIRGYLTDGVKLPVA